MSVRVLYFSGSGNSLLVGKIISRKLEGELVPFTKLMKGDINYLEGTVGFVFPVYYYDVPEIIKEILKSADISRTNYLFAVVTSGGDPGNALYQLNRILMDKHKRLDYAMDIKLGDNSIALKTKPEVLKERFGNLERLTDKTAAAVKNRETNTHILKYQFKSRLLSSVTRLGLERYYQIGNKSVIKERCNQCGICAKLCPMGNIQCNGGEVLWGNKCVDCYACINWCPQKAIRFGKIDLENGQQYRCPGIKAVDFFE